MYSIFMNYCGQSFFILVKFDHIPYRSIRRVVEVGTEVIYLCE